MKISIQKPLLEAAMKRVMPFVTGGLTASDPAQYVIVKAAKDAVSFSVVRLDAPARVVLQALPGGLVKVEKEGSVAVDGNLFMKFLRLSKIDSLMDLEFEPLAAGESAELLESDGKKNGDDDGDGGADDGDSTASTPGSDGVQVKLLLGRLRASFSTEKDEEFGLQVVDLAAEVDLDGSGDSATIKGCDFVDVVKRAGATVGDSKLDERFTVACVRAVKDNLELATLSDGLIGKGRIPSDTSKDFQAIVKYELLALSAKAIAPEEDVVLCCTNPVGDAPKCLYGKQDLEFGNARVGFLLFRLSNIKDKFPNFEKKVDNLSFSHSCKIVRQQLKDITDVMVLFNHAKTNAVFDPADPAIVFSKRESGKNAKKRLPISAPSGGRIELGISSRHMKKFVDVCEESEVEMCLSGEHSLGRLSVGPRFSMYFMPF